MKLILILSLINLILFCTPANILGVFPIPGYSHMIVYLPILEELAKRGHNITVITANTYISDTSKEFTIIDVADDVNALMEDRKDVFRSYYPPKKSSIFDIIYGSTLMDEVIYNSKQVKSFMAQSNQFDLVIVELYATVANAFKEVFNAPTIAISNMYFGDITFNIIANNPAWSVSKDQIEETFVERFKSLIWNFIVQHIIVNYYFMIRDGQIKKYFPQVRKTAVELLRDVDLVFYVDIPGLYPTRMHSPHMMQIAPTHINETAATLTPIIQDFLDQSQQGVVFFSFGTNIPVESLPEDRLNAISAAFTQLPFDILVKCDSKISQMKIICSLPNVKCVSWVHQHAVLAHGNTKAIISHCGFQTTLEAVYFAIPIVGFPSALDQFDNANRIRVVEIGLNLDLEYFEADNLKTSVLEVIRNEKFKNNIKKMSAALRSFPVSGVDVVVWWSDYLLKNNNAKHLHISSNKHQLSLNQYYNIDIIILSTVTIGMVSYLTKKYFK